MNKGTFFCSTFAGDWAPLNAKTPGEAIEEALDMLSVVKPPWWPENPQWGGFSGSRVRIREECHVRGGEEGIAIFESRGEGQDYVAVAFPLPKREVVRIGRDYVFSVT